MPDRPPLHAAQSSHSDRRVVQVLADLCRRDPACFAAVVRHGDHLERQGLAPAEATRLALASVSIALGPD